MLIRAYEPKDREAILKLRAGQEKEWFGEVGTLEGFEPEDEVVEFVLVLEDDGKIVAAVGAKRTCEIRMVMDPKGRDLAKFFREDLMPLWARTVSRLHKRGYADCFAFVPNVIKKWSNTLVRRAGFKREADRVLTFDVRAAIARVTPNG